MAEPAHEVQALAIVFVDEPTAGALAAGVGWVDLMDGDSEGLGDGRQLFFDRRSTGPGHQPVHLP